MPPVMLATWRNRRRSAFVWGGALGLLTVFTMWTNWTREYPTEEARLQLAQQVESGGLAFAKVLFGEAHSVNDFAGHLEWRALGIYPLLLGLFAVISATAVSRGAEERGELELLLTAPRSRLRVITEQWFGLVAALALACVLLLAGMLISGPVAGASPPSLAAAGLSVLNVGVVAALFGAVALLAAQVTRTRRAAGMAAGVLLVSSFLWANLALVTPALERWRWLSPLSLYGESTPLATGHVSLAALTLMLMLTAGCAVVAAWLFAKRDHGAPAVPLGLPPITMRAGRAGHATWLLRGSFQLAVRLASGSALVWGSALAVFAGLFSAVTPSIRSGFEDVPNAREAAAQLDIELAADAAVVGSLLLLILPLLLALFATTVAGAFAEEEQSGRLELDLAAPVSRYRYFCARACAALTTIAITVTIATAGLLSGVFLAGLDIAWDRVLIAGLLVALPASVVVALGFALAAWRPALASGVLSTVVAASFFLNLLAPALDLPAALRKASVFELYGRPLREGTNTADVAAMLVLVVGFFVIGSIAFTRRDISK